MGPDPTTPASGACGDDDRTRTFGLLAEACAHLTRVLDAEMVAQDGISLQTFEVLLRISRAPGGRCTMTDLSREVALTTGGTTRLADRLTVDGLVERVPCPSDRRVVHLQLTGRGTDVLATAMVHHLDALERHVSGPLAGHDEAALQAALDALRGACP